MLPETRKPASSVRSSASRPSRASIIGFGLAVLTTAACSSAPVGPEFTKEDVESLRQLTQNFVAAYNAKDAAKTSAFFSGNAVVMPPNSSTTRGKEAVEQYYKIRFAEGATDLTINPTDISGEGRLAYASGDYSLNIVPPDGGPTTRDRGKFVWIFREFNAAWLLEYVIFSSDFPPPAPPPAES
jgi:uncharacterized protein (TIGR02246 family)